MLDYRAEHFYPVRLDEVFNGRFQVVAKLGYGSTHLIEITNAPPSRHPGAKNIRQLLDSFQVASPHGTHMVLVLQVSQMSIRDMDTVFMKGAGFEEEFVKSAVKELLEALDFLHNKVQCVHTDIHPGNLLLGVDDNAVFQQLEEAEFKSPVPRKQLGDRTIYLSRLMRPQVGPLLLSDFGETCLGPGPHAGDIMPIMYRAPETLLHIQWSYAVDIWSVGLTAWDLLEGRTLFNARKEDGSFSDGVHLAELVAALGPPPQRLLDRHRARALEYWDAQGNWGEFVPIPVGKTMEAAKTKLGDGKRTMFMNFLRRVLTWDPYDRPTSGELLSDPWVTS
ncbi:hypothetical protein SCUCBS95973_004654 [Sporothrix curviconia]|uniref:non-specific serine/threonine protein kinase n=1 Tax=Sporothrix curviconia TaxID=1260050 RepID=A0ABP0BQF8_9PEZI